MIMKTILTAISLTAFLFTSCQKDEMDQGIGAGDGGKEVAYMSLNLKDTLIHTISTKKAVVGIDTKAKDNSENLENDLINSSVK